MITSGSTRTAPPPTSLTQTFAAIAAGAQARDREPTPAFPASAIDHLRAAGLLGWNAVESERPPAAGELSLVRGVSRADASVGRIFDGHLNGVERLLAQAPETTVNAELDAIRRGELLVGVWGGEPRPDDGPPATIEHSGGREFLTGVKTFCSGAGGLDRALVLAHEGGDPRPVGVWIDARDRATVLIDESWYRSSGLRASVSHRVVFVRAPILARFGGPGAPSAQPWFSRDALRTAATWAGMLDTALHAALGELQARPGRGELEELAAGRMLTAARTVDVWLDRAAAAMDDATSDLPGVALHARAAIAAAARTLLDEAAHACGSFPFATGSALDRARRDLDLFLLQHRLEPALVRAGAQALDSAG